MVQQIIKQPNGLFAVFSFVVDAFVVFEATPQEIEAYFIEEAAGDLRKRVREKISALERGEKPYYQFTMTWKQALREHLKNFPDADENSELKAIK